MRKLIRIAVALMAVIPAVSGRLNVARVPLSFEANQGQTDRAVKFLSRDGGYALFLTPAEAVFKLRKATPPDKKPAVLRMRLVGADGTAKLSGTGQYAGTANYFIGNDPNQWRTGVTTFEKVHYQGLYPGVDAPSTETSASWSMTSRWRRAWTQSKSRWSSPGRGPSSIAAAT